MEDGEVLFHLNAIRGAINRLGDSVDNLSINLAKWLAIIAESGADASLKEQIAKLKASSEALNTAIKEQSDATGT